MASIQRLDTTNLSSSPDVGSHRSFGAAVLEKSHSFRESHEGRVAGPSTSHSDALPLTSVLFLDIFTLPTPKSNAQLELRRVINAATGQASEDSSPGTRALENCSADEIKRVRVGLQDNVNRANARVGRFSEAVIKLDRFQNAMQSRKRNRADSGAHDRSSHGGPGPRGAGLGHVTKGSGRGASSSGEGIVSNTGIQKGSDKSKSTGISKRMRTSLADTRPEGRPSNLSVQRSSGVQERERESPRPSGLVTCSVEEKDKGTVVGGGSVGGNEGWEKTKFKGRRSATVKAEASTVVSTMNGTADVEREQKGSSQQHRGAGDGRSRPSEGHGFRSGPVHGSLSVQKAESLVLANGSGIRGGSKVEGDVGAQSAGKADRAGLYERERSNGKGLAKPVGRDEGRAPSVGIVPKAKGARAPRSHLVAGGGNQAGQMGRSASFAEVREKLTVTSPAKAQVPPSGPINRKRAAPSRSSSPPVASWGSSRPQKKARARRANVMPPVIAIPSKEEANGVEELGTPSSRSSPAVGGNPPKRASGGQSASQSKAQTERLSVSVGPAVSEVCLVEDGQQKIIKGRRRKQEEEEGEQKVSGTSEKSGTVVVVATSRGASVGGEENGAGAGDGVRRQGRTGRGPVTPRVVPVNSPIEKVELSPVHVKPTRVGRATVETKVAGAGRLAKNGSSERKLSGRPRRLLNNNGTEFSGEEEDDREQLSRAVQQAVDFSALTCPNSFWRQVEPYLAYVTPDDLSLLHRHMAIADEINLTSHSQSEGAAVKSPAAGDRVSDSDEVKNWNNVREQQSAKETNFRRGRGGGGWYDKVFPLSQLLLSAIISERETDDRQKISDESCADRDSDSPLHLSNHSEIDYDRRDAEGESDVENLRPESEWWSAEVKEGGYGKGSPMSGGHGSRLWAEDQDGDDILVRSSSPQSSGADMDNGGEVHVMDSQAGFGRQLGNGLMDWDEQYQRMSLDDRLSLELSSIGLLPGQAAEHHEQEVDDIGEELRRLQTEFAEQVSRNKEHLCRLKSAVIEKRPLEERAREKLAMDKLVELAYKKRSGGRSKGAAGKVAKAAALAFATRVLARVHDYEAGRSCISDPALRDRLFCVPPSLVESTPDAAMDAGAIATTAERITSPTGGGMLVGHSVGQRMEDAEKPSFNGQSSAMDYNRLKQEAWASRGRDREAFLEDDVSGYTTTRDVNTLSSNGLGGIKGKRSERDTKGAGPGPSNAKGERKTKTKPRQKTGPVLMKPVQGLVDLQSGKDRCQNDNGYGAVMRREESSMPGLPVFQDMQQPEANGPPPLDLAGVPLPGMEDMNMDQADIGSWLDFNLDDPIQSTDDGGLMGLDIPMDDLSGLMMI